MTKEEMDEALQGRRVEIARRIAAAMMSYHMGVSIQYYYKRYIMGDADGKVGESWLQMADMCIDLFDAMQRHVSDQLTKSLEHKGTIQ